MGAFFNQTASGGYTFRTRHVVYMAVCMHNYAKGYWKRSLLKST